ncbi:bifunctional phosphopantothenoylcysteine decarboxylase/phosphopantothenate--cysteine ligase CoaBC [Candidatus Roizmanbacteria bacterium CG10_big_fil_rev_8_21_14_0_10_39_12]|uniref:Coenzyme A biosynthesis bifunctional protein CoaBC n=1 Tax=Candidatus Roizmanbacteria bacterium CG10_big_fil_rev_8_21_14_0_10_39_12 TaxID=1974852 RepID=A0A2M8KQ17_9BACT|nr:MAG: bifunctional phosphopantothenoylcysteine decarboxylase/phosphopantothenate--cysteine ligase CoaBC [Candidatus Roizmanbacteria bacterium CG10_big_fil_rev_8_21_14_0_10_39_12]
MSHIVIGISSGIAAYKSLDLIQLLKKDNHKIYVMMTKKAMHIVSPGKIEEITGYPVFVNVFEDSFSYEQILKRKKVDHIEVAKKADIFVVVPSTANTIAKFAAGLADDFISTSILATTAPVLICPSMNDKMWHHPATQRNLKTLTSFGYEIMMPDTGSLACGTDGIGRLPDVKKIKKEIEGILLRKKLLEGKRVLVTGGGTIEPIDDARVITNRSTGKMGKAIAEASYRYGARVTYLHAHNAEPSQLPIKNLIFTTSEDLQKSLINKLKDIDIVFHVAAVSDFTVKRVGKKLSSSVPHSITLSPTKKIINEIKKINPKITLIGFKAIAFPSEAVVKRGHPERVKRPKDPENTWILRVAQNDSQKLFTNADVDYVIVNDISRPDIGFETEENEVYIVSKDKKIKKIEKASKKDIAQKIIMHIFDL